MDDDYSWMDYVDTGAIYESDENTGYSPQDLPSILGVYDPGMDVEYGQDPYDTATLDEIIRVRSDENPMTVENTPIQDFGASSKVYAVPGDIPTGFTSQWQTSGSDRIFVNDDGTATGINTETNEVYNLTPTQVQAMIQNGQLNSYQSGYNTATGGTAIAPGGGTHIGGSTFRMPDGSLVDANKGTITPPTKPTTTGGSGAGAGSGSSTDWMKMLMPLLLLAMMNRGGSSSTTQTVIPNLTASRDVLPYDASRRPGSAPQRYLSDVKYMAEGGLASLFGGSMPRPMDWGDWRGQMRDPREKQFNRTPQPDDMDDAGPGPGGYLWSGVPRNRFEERMAMNRPKPEVSTQPVPGGISTLPVINQQPAPYSQPSGRRPGAAPIDYGVSGFAGGGGISRLLKGPGDGTSDDIKATIDGQRPARLATGEFVVDARTVSELGNGSTEAGAAKLNKMVERVHNTRKKAKRGKDSKADRHLPA